MSRPHTRKEELSTSNLKPTHNNCDSQQSSYNHTVSLLDSILPTQQQPKQLPDWLQPRSHDRGSVIEELVCGRQECRCVKMNENAVEKSSPPLFWAALTASIFYYLYSQYTQQQQYKEKSSSKTLPIPPPSYKRLGFTTPPVFGDEFIVGNLNEIVGRIEEDLLESMKTGRNTKECLPFHCLINPPRHGKS